jgi:hypothetical protein
MSQTNFLIGRGELLTHAVKPPKRKPKKADAYTLEEALRRLIPQFSNVAASLDSLPSEACPGDFGVARLMMNPSYIARSYFPVAMLKHVGLESVGSRTVKVTPDAWTKKRQIEECTTTELFVIGKRNSFRNLKDWAKHIEPETDEASDISRIERFSAVTSKDRLAVYNDDPGSLFEVGLHLLSDQFFVKNEFLKYAKKMNAKIFADYSFTAGNLWFVPIEIDPKNIDKLAEFIFVRIIRPAPKLRSFFPLCRNTGVSINCTLPSDQPLSSEPRVAILDGGLPMDHAAKPWVKSYHILDAKAKDNPNGPMHGLAVTSAFLFGPVPPHGTASRPFSYVDHLRVLDEDVDSENPLELYRTLGLVEQVLLSRQYEFINLSLGPDLPIEDTDVHAWTSVIDELLNDGETLMTVAVGNNGACDQLSGNARVQVPSDCVNALAVGSANDTCDNWSRAPYSAIGPGRSPGVVKPDLMAFGGDTHKYFHVLSPGRKPTLIPQQGTSFASPYLLRSAVGIRAILGAELSPLAIKALLVHGADPAGHDKLEVGWGKIPEELMSIIACPDGVARVVYQGKLKPSKYLRAPLPLPEGGLAGNIKLKATFCYASPTDPQDAAAYTRAGLEVVFRPNEEKTNQTHAKTKPFFDLNKYATEGERRSDMGKWETVLHCSRNMRGTTLKNPAFDIHYTARDGGGPPTKAENISYALIITIEAPKHPNLYNDILRSYSKILAPIRPQISLPIRM